MLEDLVGQKYFGVVESRFLPAGEGYIVRSLDGGATELVSPTGVVLDSASIRYSEIRLSAGDIPAATITVDHEVWRVYADRAGCDLCLARLITHSHHWSESVPPIAEFTVYLSALEYVNGDGVSTFRGNHSSLASLPVAETNPVSIVPDNVIELGDGWL